MTTTRLSGLRAVRTRSQVSKSIYIREATGKRRTTAPGRDAQTYFDLGVDCKVPWRDWSIRAAWWTPTTKACLPPYSDGCFPPAALCSKRSPGRPLLSDPEGAGFSPLEPLHRPPLCCCHTSEKAESLCAAWSRVRLGVKGRKWNRQCFQI